MCTIDQIPSTFFPKGRRMPITFRLNLAFRILSMTLLTGALTGCSHQETAHSLAPGPDDKSNQLPGIIVTGHSHTYHPLESSAQSVRIYSTPTAVIPPAPAAPHPLPVPPPPKKPTKPHTSHLPLQKDIFFAFNSSRISYANRAVLVAYSSLLKKNPRYTIVLMGHTDPTGTRKYNHSLGLKRALSAKRVLLAQGISGKRIRIYSDGKKPVRLLPRCHKPSCYSRDRAVRIKVFKGFKKIRSVKKESPSGTSGNHTLKKKTQ